MLPVGSSRRKQVKATVCSFKQKLKLPGALCVLWFCGDRLAPFARKIIFKLFFYGGAWPQLAKVYVFEVAVRFFIAYLKRTASEIYCEVLLVKIWSVIPLDVFDLFHNVTFNQEGIVLHRSWGVWLDAIYDMTLRISIYSSGAFWSTFPILFK